MLQIQICCHNGCKKVIAAPCLGFGMRPLVSEVGREGHIEIYYIESVIKSITS